MNSTLPKQFILIHEKSILQICIENFYQYDQNIQIIVVLSEIWIDFWKNNCEKKNFYIPHQVVIGGEERYFSIKNALPFCKGKVIVVHDAVRPFVSKKLLKTCFDTAKVHQAVIPVIALKDSIRKMDKENSTAQKREDFVLVQTPQVFESSILQKAYQIPYSEEITDDASLVEKSGIPITLCEGDETNFKITYPLDVELAKVLVQDWK